MFRKAAAWLRNALALFGLLFAIVSATPLVGWWGRQLANPWHGCEGDVLVVLAGGSQGDVIGESSYLRALYAVRAYRECHYRRIFLSGHDASVAMLEFMTGQSVPMDRIEVENDSNSTFENVRQLSPLLRRELTQHQDTRIVLLTSDYHIYRSIRLFNKAGFTLTAYPAPDAIKRSGFWEKRWTAFVDLVVESSKIGYYRWKGWI